MEITVTIQGDILSPEIARTLQALGVALSGTVAAKEPDPAPETVQVVETPAVTETAVKKPRKRKNADPEPAAEETQTEEPEETPEAAPEKQTITLESLREKVVLLAKSGKSNEIKAAFQSVGATKLSDVGKADYADLDAKLSAI
jgi:hypothetical protein